jgi:hypothetical protein
MQKYQADPVFVILSHAVSLTDFLFNAYTFSLRKYIFPFNVWCFRNTQYLLTFHMNISFNQSKTVCHFYHFALQYVVRLTEPLYSTHLFLATAISWCCPFKRNQNLGDCLEHQAWLLDPYGPPYNRMQTHGGRHVIINIFLWLLYNSCYCYYYYLYF